MRISPKVLLRRVVTFIAKKCKSFNRKAILLSLFMIVFSYCLSNFERPLFVETTLLQVVSLAKNFISGGLDSSEHPDSIIFVDVSYDRDLITLEENGEIKGKVDVTDKSKLERFLRVIESSKYKAIVLDIDFSNKYLTESDLAIGDLINKMDNIYIAKGENITISKISNKAYWVDHYVNALDNSFAKVSLERNDTLSLPMKMYQDNSKVKFTNLWGLFYFANGCLARRCIYPKMYIGPDVTPYYLGQDLLNDSKYTPEEVRTLVKNKFVFVGAVEGELDNYNTYNGEYPGNIINANIYLSLWNKAYKYPLWLIMMQFFLFYICGLHVFQGSNDNAIRPNTVFSIIRVSSFIWLHYTAILAIVCMVIYLLFGEAYDILYSSTALSIIHGIVKLFNYK